MKLYTIFLVTMLFSSLLQAQNHSRNIEEHQSYVQNNIKIERDFYVTMDPVPHKTYEHSLKILGNHSTPFSSLHHITRADGKMIYDQTYRIGEFGLRQIAPEYYSKNPTRHLITAGDSNTFGEGISESDLLAVHLAKAIPQSHPYNFGARGAGPHDTMALMEFFPWDKLIKEPNGIFIYNYYDFQVERVVGFRHYIEWSLGNSAYYKLDSSGDAVYSGSFNSRMLTYFFKMINYFPQISKLFPVMPRPRHQHLELVAKIFLKMQNEYLKKFPQGHFFVAVNYFYGNINPERLKELEQELTKNKISFLVVPALENNPDFIYPDGHLTPKGHAIEAELLLKVLPLNQIVR